MCRPNSFEFCLLNVDSVHPFGQSDHQKSPTKKNIKQPTKIMRNIKPKFSSNHLTVIISKNTIIYCAIIMLYIITKAQKNIVSRFLFEIVWKMSCYFKEKCSLHELYFKYFFCCKSNFFFHFKFEAKKWEIYLWFREERSKFITLTHISIWSCSIFFEL
jgi:hypothetical protein